MTLAAPSPALPASLSLALSNRLEEAAFRSGGALVALSALLRQEGVPLSLLRDRLALGAAEASLKLAGQPARAMDLRDALHLTREGDHLGPAGEVYHSWRRAVAQPLSYASLAQALPQFAAADIKRLWPAPPAPPVTQVATLLEAALLLRPADDSAALILADAALARAMGWAHMVPLLASGLDLRDLRKSGEALRLACHHALALAASRACDEAQDLSRRAAKLLAVTPHLRAKSAAAAISRFLANDALSPSQGLAGLMSDRSARRICDRLVSLGALRELTGRDSFRLYGL